MRLLLIGAPGAGKGTQGERLATRLGVRHIATGDLLRAEVKEGTPLGKSVADYLDRGQLVPDQLILDLVMPKLLAASRDGGYILDGFPRSVAQAVEARELADHADAAAEHVVFLQAPREALVQRLLARAVAEGRSDDTQDVIVNRLRIFEEATSPLVDYYRGRNMLHVIDADQSADDVMAAILAAIGTV